MFRLLNKDISPVGGIRFIDPDTGFNYNRNYTTISDLEKHVSQYRLQNHLEPIGNFRDVWENWICQEPNMDKKCCPVAEVVKRSFAQYFQGGKIWVRTKLKGTLARFVKREVADQRAKVCIDCRSNLQNIGHTMANYYADNFIAAQVGQRKTDYDSKLFTCRICTCLLRSKVHYPSEDVGKSLTLVDIGRLTREPRTISGKPLRCWQLDAIDKAKNGLSDSELE